MPTTYKVLGQSNPAANTNIDVYTVTGAGKQVVVSTITVCNTSNASITYRVAIRPDAAAIATQHYIAYDVTLPAYTTDNLTIGATLDTSDVITVRSSAATTAFSVFGGEIT